MTLSENRVPQTPIVSDPSPLVDFPMNLKAQAVAVSPPPMT